MQVLNLPVHLAIIMDGNGRWATLQGLSRSEGHKAGTEAARNIITECRKLGIKHLTLYAFSKENWLRPAEEVGFLFSLLVKFLNSELSSLMKQNICFKVLGEIKDLPLATEKILNRVIDKTKNNVSMILNVALNYSARDEIVMACRSLMQSGLTPKELSPELISDYLYTKGQPDPDLLIRTSGELRISNFLLYQSAYTEFYFTSTLWPDFNAEELEKALSNYQERKRRFGQV